MGHTSSNKTAQKTFAGLGVDRHRKSTRWHEFLQTMNRQTPWED
ncbi:MAG: hypothetical protein NZ602_06280 [Thermoguttaceae bacterium]|nr:hypothetical protein [Thermoguttaceae bacterium]MDW8036874.1 hypothetical protein [Thermoguttaceae bacterium]